MSNQARLIQNQRQGGQIYQHLKCTLISHNICLNLEEHAQNGGHNVMIHGCITVGISAVTSTSNGEQTWNRHIWLTVKERKRKSRARRSGRKHLEEKTGRKRGQAWEKMLWREYFSQTYVPGYIWVMLKQIESGGGVVGEGTLLLKKIKRLRCGTRGWRWHLPWSQKCLFIHLFVYLCTFYLGWVVKKKKQMAKNC